MKRILLVEDNEDNRDLVFAMLEGLYEIRACADGLEALAVLGQDNDNTLPDVLLIDISLPTMDGIELLGKIRRREELLSIPVIALTSFAMRGDRERFLAAGFDAYVSKPIVDEAELIDAIERLTGNSQESAGN